MASHHTARRLPMFRWSTALPIAFLLATACAVGGISAAA
jgi:hypothetical protein